MRAARVLVAVSVVVAGLLAPSAAALAGGDADPGPGAAPSADATAPPWAASACRDQAADECSSWRDQRKAVREDLREQRADIFAQWRAGDITTEQRNALLAEASASARERLAELREERRAAQEAWRLEQGADPDAADDEADDDSADADKGRPDGVGQGQGRGHEKGLGNGHGKGLGNGHAKDVTGGPAVG